MKKSDVEFEWKSSLKQRMGFNGEIEDNNQEKIDDILEGYDSIVENYKEDNFTKNMIHERSFSPPDLYDDYKEIVSVPENSSIICEDGFYEDSNQMNVDIILAEEPIKHSEQEDVRKQDRQETKEKKNRTNNKKDEFKEVFVYITQRYRLIYYNGNLYAYDRNKYLLIDNDVMLGRFLGNDIIQKLITTSSTLHLALLKQLTMIASKVKPQDHTSHMPFFNCILDVKNDKIIKHSPDYISFINLPIRYTSDAYVPCPTFNQYISTICNGDTELEELILTIVGYFLLVECNDAKKFFVIIGEGGTGKSTFGKVIESIIGGDVCSNVPIHNLDAEFSKAEFDLKILNISMDLPDETINRQQIADIKNITGGDKVFTNVKNKNMKSFYTKIKLLFGSNHLLKMEVEDKAFIERLVCIPFNTVISPEMQDKKLAAKIANERGGIVQRVIPYAKKFLDNNMQFPYCEAAERLKMQCINEKQSSFEKFLEERCEFSYQYKSPSEQLYNEYVGYCDENGFKALSIPAFHKKIQEYPVTEGRWGIPGKKNKQFRGYIWGSRYKMKVQ